MTTQTTDNDAKKLGGYLKEKLTIAWSRFSDDELVRAVTKVSSHMLKIPNEKHLQRLINATYGQYNSGGNDYGDVNKWIVEALESHLHAHNWVVVLKTAIAYHRLMQDGSDAWNVAMSLRRGLFSLSHTKDLADSPDGAEQQIFITNYLRYLEERQIAQTANHNRMKGMRIENQAFANQLLAVPGREAVTVTSSLLLQFETAIDVQFIPHAVNNFATLQGHRNCLNDAKLLFVAISRKMVNILEKIETMDPQEREAWLPIYKRYAVASKKFANKLTEMKNARVAWGEALPTIRPLPEDILEQLAMMLDPKYQSKNVGSGELPRTKLSDLQSQQQQSQADHMNHQEQIKKQLAEQAQRNTPPILDGTAITGDNKQAEQQQQQKKGTDAAMHDIFSPEGGAKNNNNNNTRSGAASSGGGGMPDLFSNGPTKPTSNQSSSSNVDLFGNTNNKSNPGSAQSNQGLAPPPARNNIDDLFGPSPTSTTSQQSNSNQNRSSSQQQQNNKHDDLFGPAPSSNNNNSNNTTASSSNNNNNNNSNSNQQEYKPAHSDLFGGGGFSSNNKPASSSGPKHSYPADPFANIGSSSASPSTSSPSQQPQQQQQQQGGSSSSGNSNFVDFFSTAPQNNNNNNNQNQNQNQNSNGNPSFDPFAPAGSRAW